MTDDEQERTALGTVLWILGLVLLIVVLVGCGGGFQGVCGVKPLGQSDSGLAFVQVKCEPIP